MARMKELLTAAELRQDGTDAAKYRNVVSLLDDEASRSGVDYLTLAMYGEIGKRPSLPGESMNDGRASPQGTHSAWIAR